MDTVGDPLYITRGKCATNKKMLANNDFSYEYDNVSKGITYRPQLSCAAVARKGASINDYEFVHTFNFDIMLQASKSLITTKSLMVIKNNNRT